MSTTTSTASAVLPSTDRYTLLSDPERPCRVGVETRVRLDDYRPVTDPADMSLLLKLAVKLRGLNVVGVSATREGGGVAMMNQVDVPLAMELGVNLRWLVLEAPEAFFQITKGWHNTQQDVDGRKDFTIAEKAFYWDGIRKNAQLNRDDLMAADVVIIHDPQPAGLIWYLRTWGYKGKIIYRNHIQTMGVLMCTPGTMAAKVWDFLVDECFVLTCDAYVSHPVRDFVPPNVPANLVWYMPATYSRIDDLNRELTDDEVEGGFAFIADQLALNEDQLPIDRSKRYILLMARFDPAKGMDLAMEHYRRFRALCLAADMPEADIPDLVILGNGSVDDPDGKPVLEYIMKLRRTTYADIGSHIKVARVPHYDQAINAVMRGSWIVIQPSTKEGFETRASDGIDKGKPVIGSAGTGIAIQILPGKSGYVLDPHDHNAWASAMTELALDDKLYTDMCASTLVASREHNYNFTTIPGLLSWFYLIWMLRRNPQPGNHRWVLDVARQTRSCAISVT